VEVSMRLSMGKGMKKDRLVKIFQDICLLTGFVGSIATILGAGKYFYYVLILLTFYAVYVIMADFEKNIKRVVVSFLLVLSVGCIYALGSGVKSMPKDVVRENIKKNYSNLSESNQLVFSNKKKIKTDKIVVLVPAFENSTGIHSEVRIDRDRSVDGEVIKYHTVDDRYSEGPRTVLESILVSIPSISVVERQQLNKILQEQAYRDFVGNSMDSMYVIEVGKKLGANVIAMGTIISIDTVDVPFRGYGIETLRKSVVATVGVRLIDIGSGRIIYTKEIKGEDSVVLTAYGGMKKNDMPFLAIKKALDALRTDQEFLMAFKNIHLN